MITNTLSVKLFETLESTQLYLNNTQSVSKLGPTRSPLPIEVYMWDNPTYIGNHVGYVIYEQGNTGIDIPVDIPLLLQNNGITLISGPTLAGKIYTVEVDKSVKKAPIASLFAVSGNFVELN